MRARVNDVSLYYEVRGHGNPVLCIHGFPLSGELWSPLTSLAADHRWIVPDLRGHGRSEASEEVTMATFADDLAGLLDAIEETRPPVVVGMSMGGYIAFEFLRRHGSRVRGVVLANTRAQADTPEAAQARHDLAGRAAREGSAIVAEAMLPALFGPSAPEELRERWRGIMASTNPVGVAAALRAMAGRPDSFSTLAEARCPILIVAGEDDTLTPLADSQAMLEAAPRAKLEVLAGAGHMSPVERPDAFAEALGRFLADLPA